MSSVVRMKGVSVRRGSTMLLNDVNLQIDAGERWIIMGPNGAGKTTLLSLMSARMFPTAGEIEILDELMGAVDLAELKPRIGWASSAMVNDLPPRERVVDVVMTGAWDVSGRWREEYDPGDESRARALLEQWGMAELAERTYGTLSEGERKRTLIARALMSDPELLLLDEPGAGLDLGGREDLVARMRLLAEDEEAPTQVVITHHVEEIPPGFTHLLLLGRGTVVASGSLMTVLTAENLTAAFAMPISVTSDGGRWFAQRVG